MFNVMWPILRFSVLSVINERKNASFMITIVINQIVSLIYFRFLIIKKMLLVVDYRHRDFVFTNLL